MSLASPDPARSPAPPTAEELRASFDAAPELTLGLEEELLLLDPETLDLAPVAREVIGRAGGDGRFQLELPAAQLEIVTKPHASVPAAIDELARGRADLLRAADGLARPAAAPVHPFSAREGELLDEPRYRRTVEQFGRIAHRQIVSALQVHVAVGGAERTLAVYNALRSYLPELAALAASGPFHEGVDSGLASIRPKISEELLRQGVPPAIASWDDFADALRWGAKSGYLQEHAAWWWELRPHPRWGTLELRVPDAQATVADAAAVAAVAHSLVAWLAARDAAGEELPCDPVWRVAENRWSACRYGVEGTLADLRSGRLTSTRERLHELIDELGPTAGELGCSTELEAAHGLAEENGAMRQRAVARDGGVRRVAEWLAECFGAGLAWEAQSRV